MAVSAARTHLRRQASPGLREVAQPAGRRETKVETFRRLAQHRVSNAIKAMGLIEKLGNRDLYEVREGDVEKIIATLQTGVDNVKHALTLGGKTPPPLRFD